MLNALRLSKLWCMYKTNSSFIVISSDVQQVFSNQTFWWHFSGAPDNTSCAYYVFHNIFWKEAKSRPVLGTKELSYNLIMSCSMIPFLWAVVS